MNNNICDLIKFKKFVVDSLKEPLRQFFNSNNIKINFSLSYCSNSVFTLVIRYNSNVDSSKINYLYDLNNHTNGLFVFKPNVKDIIKHDISFKHIAIGFYPDSDKKGLFFKLGQIIGMFTNTNGISYINCSILDFKERDKNKQTFILSLNKNNWYNRDIKYSDLKLLDKKSYKILNDIAINNDIEYPLRYVSFIKNGWINKINNPLEDKYLKNNIRYCELVKTELINIINTKKANIEPLDIYNLKDYRLLDAEEDFYRSFEDLSLLYEELGLEPFKISYDNDFSNLNRSTKKDKELIRLVYSLH